MTRESDDYYKRLRNADYDVNPFNMKMLDSKDAKKNLPLLLPHGPNEYSPKITNLKTDSSTALDEWTKNYKEYNMYVTDDKYKVAQGEKSKNLIVNRNSVKFLKKKINADAKENDTVLYNQINTLEKFKKKLTDKKIEYNKLLHSANASDQLNNDKQTLYTQTTVRLILQIIGVFIAGGIVYKVGS
tara:strand:+ start:165 stop:722 length:558 start_codon:yes stop_codon:yes gene_type:complete